MEILILILGIGWMLAFILIPIIKLLRCLNAVAERWDTYTDDEKIEFANAIHNARVASERNAKRTKSRSMYYPCMRPRKRSTRIRH